MASIPPAIPSSAAIGPATDATPGSGTSPLDDGLEELRQRLRRRTARASWRSARYAAGDDTAALASPLDGPTPSVD